MLDTKSKHEYMATANYYSERINHDPGFVTKKFHKNDTLEEGHFDAKRDISPYRVENFVGMLHQFGVSDSTIQRKLVNSPIRHNKFPYDEASESNLQSSVIRNRKARLPTIKSSDENTVNNSRLMNNQSQVPEIVPLQNPLDLNNQNEVMLPDLNNSRSSLKSNSARKSIKNRRNINVKQSYDQQNFHNPGPSIDNPVHAAQPFESSQTKVVGMHNIDTTAKFQPHENDGHSPAYNAIDSPSYGSKHIKTESDYYGSYAKIID